MKLKGNTLLWSAIILTIGLIQMGLSIKSGIENFKRLDRKVTVKGLSEREVPANKVTWSLVYKELGNDPSDMYQLIGEKNEKVVAFLKSGGIQDEEISINPPTISDRQADTYGNEIMNYRYKASCVITVASTNVDRVRALMLRQGQLMRQGIAIVSEEYGSNNVSYEYTSLTDIKPQMVEEAMQNAHATAEQFAKDSHTHIGGIVTASQGQFSIDDRDANTPYVKRIRVVTTVEYAIED